MLTFHARHAAPMFPGGPSLLNGRGVTSLNGLRGLGNLGAGAYNCTAAVCAPLDSSSRATFEGLQNVLNRLLAARSVVFRNTAGTGSTSLVVDGKIGGNTTNAVRAIAAAMPAQPRGAQWAPMAKFALDGDTATLNSIASQAQAWTNAAANALAFLQSTTPVNTSAVDSGPARPTDQIPLEQLLAQNDRQNTASGVITPQPGAGTQAKVTSAAPSVVQFGTTSIQTKHLVIGALALGGAYLLMRRRSAAPLAGARRRR